MKIGSKHQTAEMRRQQILSAADLVLIEVGIEDFTVDRVAEKAGIAKGTIYKYFKNRDELLSVISIKAASLLLERFKQKSAEHPGSVEKLKVICWASYHYYRTYPIYYELLAYIERPEFTIDIQDYIKISHAIQDFCEGIVIRGQQEGEINPQLNPQLVTRIMWASNIGVIQFIKTKQKLIENVHDTPMEEVMNISIQILTNGIASSKNDQQS